MYKIYDDTDMYWIVSTKRKAMALARRFQKELGTDGKVWVMASSGVRIEI